MKLFRLKPVNTHTAYTCPLLQGVTFHGDRNCSFAPYSVEGGPLSAQPSPVAPPVCGAPAADVAVVAVDVRGGRSGVDIMVVGVCGPNVCCGVWDPKVLWDRVGVATVVAATVVVALSNCVSAMIFCRTSRIFSCRHVLVGKTSWWLAWNTAVACPGRTTSTQSMSRHTIIKIPFEYHSNTIQIPLVFEWYFNGTSMVLGGIMANSI